MRIYRDRCLQDFSFLVEESPEAMIGVDFNFAAAPWVKHRLREVFELDGGKLLVLETSVSERRLAASRISVSKMTLPLL